MIRLNMTLIIAGREALRAGGNGEDPWEWFKDSPVVPAHDSWVWISDKRNAASPIPVVRARAGHAEHFRWDGAVAIKLYIDTMSKRAAQDIGVEWHPWMNDTLAPVTDEKKAAERADLRRDVGNWKAKR